MLLTALHCVGGMEDKGDWGRQVREVSGGSKQVAARCVCPTGGGDMGQWLACVGLTEQERERIVGESYTHSNTSCNVSGSCHAYKCGVAHVCRSHVARTRVAVVQRPSSLLFRYGALLIEYGLRLIIEYKSVLP